MRKKRTTLKSSTENGRAYAVAEKDSYKFAKRYRFRIVEEGKR
ncbi:MAG TPA: hypothetical protein PLP57_06485 [Candidatus Saccharicenans sp.]|jgi:hypothetical protein|nr:hypothetical protein [Candidatus Saccharicenans sp.]